MRGKTECRLYFARKIFFIGIMGCLYLGVLQKQHPSCWRAGVETFSLLHAAPLPNPTSRPKFVLRSVYDRQRRIIIVI